VTHLLTSAREHVEALKFEACLTFTVTFKYEFGGVIFYALLITCCTFMPSGFILASIFVNLITYVGSFR